MTQLVSFRWQGNSVVWIDQALLELKVRLSGQGWSIRLLSKITALLQSSVLLLRGECEVRKEKVKTERMLKRSRLGGVRDIVTTIFTFRHPQRVTEWKGACLCRHTCHCLPYLNCYFKAERGKWRNDTERWGEIPETKKKTTPRKISNFHYMLKSGAFTKMCNLCHPLLKYSRGNLPKAEG